MKKYLKPLFIFVMLFAFGCTFFKKPVLKEQIREQPGAKEPQAAQPIAQETAPNKVDSKGLALAPNFQLQDIYQDIYILSSYKDKQPLLLFFWTTWCPFCQRELSVLNNMYSGLVEDGLEVLSINVGERPDTVRDFVKDYYLAYRVLLDKDTSVSNSYGMLGVPTYVLIDKQGYIVFKDNYFPQRKYKELIATQEK